MAREQLGICAEANLHGCYLLFNALEGQEFILRQKLARMPALFERLADHFSEAILTGVIAIGSHYWDSLYPDNRPDDLNGFPAVDNIPVINADLLVQIRSDRQDVNYIACQQVLQLLKTNVELLEHLSTFRYLDGRDLTGFIDAPNNPRGRLRRQVALISREQQPDFEAGSYVYIQRFILDLVRWQQLAVAEQEAIMGYNKIDGKYLPADLLLSNSHIMIMQQGNAAVPMTVLQQNMPYAGPYQQGNLMIMFAADSNAFEKLLLLRSGKSESGVGYDLLLDYSYSDLAAAFFAPSISFLEYAATRYHSSES